VIDDRAHIVARQIPAGARRQTNVHVAAGLTTSSPAARRAPPAACTRPSCRPTAAEATHRGVAWRRCATWPPRSARRARARRAAPPGCQRTKRRTQNTEKQKRHTSHTERRHRPAPRQNAGRGRERTHNIAARTRSLVGATSCRATPHHCTLGKSLRGRAAAAASRKAFVFALSIAPNTIRVRRMALGAEPGSRPGHHQRRETPAGTQKMQQGGQAGGRRRQMLSKAAALRRASTPRAPLRRPHGWHRVPWYR